MSVNRMGLGKGLEALIRETSGVVEQNDVHVLALNAILPNPSQPRKEFMDEALDDLVQSIQQQGVLQPILVRPLKDGNPPKYEIVAGERRWRAARKAGLNEIPVVVRDMTDQETLVAALVENMQREDLNPIEEALGIQTLRDEFQLSQEKLAEVLGKSRSAIANSLRLLGLPAAFHNDIANKVLSSGHARALLSISEPTAQQQLRNIIIDESLSVREAEGMAVVWKETGMWQSNLDQAVSIHGKDAIEGGGTAMSERKPRRPQSSIVLAAQQQLKSLVDLPVKITGSGEKGKITISYSSQSELDAFIASLAAVYAGE